MNFLLLATFLVGWAGTPLRVLFVGNSLTYSNDLAGIVKALADSSHVPMQVSTMAYPDFSLEDHWADGRAPDRIRQGGLDYVVLQQGPSALPESRVILRDYVARFDRIIKRTGARTALYMVWPSLSRSSDFDAVRVSYSAAAQDVAGMLLPAGDAWPVACSRGLELPLYLPDGLHPTPAGSYLAALVIFARLAGLSPIGLPYRLELASGVTITFREADARIMQRAAAVALAGKGTSAGACAS